MKSLFDNWRTVINEGGNVFVGKTASIPKDYIEPTLNKYKEELNRIFPLKKKTFEQFKPVGSVGKKLTSGDIDLANDVRSYFPSGEVTPEELDSWNVDPVKWEERFNKLKLRARSRTDAELGWRAFLMELSDYINRTSELIITDSEKIGPGVMFSLFPQFDENGEQQDIGVQIDWMIGNTEWLEFAYYSDPPSETDPFLKGLHRTQLLLSMFLVKGLSYNHSAGIKDKKTKKLITNSPKEVLELLGKLYRAPLERSTTNNFHDLYGWLNENATPEEIDEVLSAYIKILDRTKSVKLRDQLSGEEKHCGYIPKELEDFWISKQQTLMLSGKYICRDINEKIWNHIQGN